MNIAILMGFIKFLQGIQSGTWEPPKREKNNNGRF